MATLSQQIADDLRSAGFAANALADGSVIVELSSRNVTSTEVWKAMDYAGYASNLYWLERRNGVCHVVPNI